MPYNEFSKYTPISVKTALSEKTDTAFRLNEDADREYLVKRAVKSKELYNKVPVFLELAFRLYKAYSPELDVTVSFSKKSEAKYLKLHKSGEVKRDKMLIIRFATHRPKNYKSFDYTYSPVQINLMEHRQVDYKKCLNVICEFLKQEGFIKEEKEEHKKERIEANA